MGNRSDDAFTGEGPAAVFVASIIAPLNASASTPIRGQPGSRRWNQYGGRAALLRRVRQGHRPWSSVRHDHGSQYMSDHFQKEIGFLGVKSSPAFVRAPEGNGCAERFIRTLKETFCGCGRLVIRS